MMDIFEKFKNLFFSVWQEGILGINFTQIIIGLLIFLVFLIFRGLISSPKALTLYLIITFSLDMSFLIFDSNNNLDSNSLNTLDSGRLDHSLLDVT